MRDVALSAAGRGKDLSSLAKGYLFMQPGSTAIFILIIIPSLHPPRPVYLFYFGDVSGSVCEGIGDLRSHDRNNL
jgi:hypothetical protein